MASTNNKRWTSVNVKDLNNLSRKQWLIYLSVLILIVALIYCIYWLFRGRFYEWTDDAYVSGNQVRVMPEITGHVTSIRADETNLVEKGIPLVTLEKTDAEIALKAAQDDLALTTRNVGQLYTAVDQAKANLAVAKDNYVKAKEDYDRRQKLVVNATISSEELRHAKIAMDMAQNSVRLAEHQLESAIILVKNTDLYQHPQIRQAADKLRNAYLTWRRTTIYAPATGFVAKRRVQVGQQVTPNTVLMIIVPLDQVWVDANFKESQLQHIRIGQKATLYADAYGGDIEYQGVVMGLNPGTGSAFDLLPPQNATGNWIKIVQRLPVRITIDEKQLKKHPLRIGLSMDVSVNTRDRTGPTLSEAPQTKIIYATQDYSAEIKDADKIIDDIVRANAKNLELEDSDNSNDTTEKSERSEKGNKTE